MALLHVFEKEERRLFDQLCPTPAHSSFRKPTIPLPTSFVSDEEEDSDDEIFGLNITPPRNIFQNENPPNAGTKTQMSSTAMDNGCDQMDIVVDGFSSCSLLFSHYIPPSAENLQSQAQRPGPSGYAKPTIRGQSGVSHDETSLRALAARNHDDMQRRRREEEELDAAKNETFERELLALRKEHERRQASQQKEFEDGNKYRLQCEQFQLQLEARGQQLGHQGGGSSLEALRSDVQTVRSMMQEVFYDHVDPDVKAGLEEKIAAAEDSLEQKQAEVDRANELVQAHAGEWLEVGALSALLDTPAMRGLRAGRDAQVLLLDRHAATLRQLQALAPPDMLDAESVALLQKCGVANCTTYLTCGKDKTFARIVALDSKQWAAELTEQLAQISPTLTGADYGGLRSAVNEKVSQLQEQIYFVDTTVAELSSGALIDEVCFSLRERLEGSVAMRLREQGSSDVLLLDRALRGLEHIRTQHPTEQLDADVLKFWREKNASLVGDPGPRGSAPTTSSATPAGGDAGLLGPSLPEHAAAIEAAIAASPPEHREGYKECLEMCLKLSARLDSLAEKGDGKDKRNERRSAVCQSTVFLQKRLDDIPGKTKRDLLSHIFQLVIDIASTKDMISILELSIIPSSLCLGNIERARVFHDLAASAAPVCRPLLDVAEASPFDRRQRVRVVGLFAAQVAYCVDLNSMVGMSAAGLEKTLETVWHWFVSCGNVLSHLIKAGSSNTNSDATRSIGEICDALKVFLNIAGVVLLNSFGPRFEQFLVKALKQILVDQPEAEARGLVALLGRVCDGSGGAGLACVADSLWLSPLSCFARVKKCEWGNTSKEWQRQAVALKRELTEVKKLVGKAFNQLDIGDTGLRKFQVNMGLLKQQEAMQNPDLRKKVLFFLSDKALSTCRDFKPGLARITTDVVVAPLASAVLWMMESQKGMAELFFSGLCSYCPFVYQVSLAASQDDAVNRLELGYLEDSADDAKWQVQMKFLLAFYASLIAQAQATEAGRRLPHFTAEDAWLWLSRTVNFCLRNKVCDGQPNLPDYILGMLYEFINITAPIFMSGQYRVHFRPLLALLRDEVLPSVLRDPLKLDFDRLSEQLKHIEGELTHCGSC